MLNGANERGTGSLQTLIKHTVLASIAEGVLVNDVAGRVTLVNRSAAQLLRVDAKTSVGQPIRVMFESFTSRARTALLEAMQRVYADPYSYADGQGVTETLIEVDSQVIQAYLSPLLEDAGEFLGIVTVLRDITREVAAERVKTEFVSNVSHELRSPLTSIKGYVDLLLSGDIGKLQPLHEDYLNVIRTNANHLVRLIDDLLDVSRFDSGRFELEVFPIDAESLIIEALEMVRPQVDQKHLQLTTQLQPRVGAVLGDRGRLVQVLLNLLSNACRYTPEGGEISVRLSKADSVLRVDVIDTGMGIALEDQSKIFQRFYRVNEQSVKEVQGTGLGLPIAKMLVEMHGGRIWVESQVGQGSMFTVILPLKENEIAQVVAPTMNSHTVLVVEDEAELAVSIEQCLRHAGYRVILTTHGHEAIALARAQHIDLIALDMFLPDIGGMEVLRQLKIDRATRDIPVIVLSVVRAINDGQTEQEHTKGEQPSVLNKLLQSIEQVLTAVAA